MRFKRFKVHEAFVIEKFLYDQEIMLGKKIRALSPHVRRNVPPGICAQLAEAVAQELRQHIRHSKFVSVYVYSRSERLDVFPADRPLEVVAMILDEKFYAEEG